MSQPPPSSNRTGKGFLIFIGISLILIGGVFIWLMARSYLRAKEMREWPQVECTILRSEIVERRHDPYSPLEYQHQVTYGYTYKKVDRISRRISLRGADWSSKPAKAMSGMEAFPPGTTTYCYINPDDPDLAILKPDSLAPGYSIWFPCLFVVGGMGIVFRVIRPKKTIPL